MQHLMTVLISERERLYRGTEVETSSQQSETPAQGQRGMAAWVSEEEIQHCPSSQTSNLADHMCCSATSLDINMGMPNNTKQTPQGKAGQAVSPSKQAKSLPSWKYSFKSSSTRAQLPKIGGSSVDVSNSGNWLMNGLSSLRSHRRTSSGERVGKDSVLSHRLSIYDNVTASIVSVPSVTSSPWSTSSCEISVVNSVSSEPSALSSDKDKWVEMSVEEKDITESSEALELCVSSTGCSEYGNMDDNADESTDPDDNSQALNNLITELKDELKKQKRNYEARIQRYVGKLIFLQNYTQIKVNLCKLIVHEGH